jgi:UDP-GlcNAc:undecaprenyl-phosphate GlcNAc-1-phosphate transferase
MTSELDDLALLALPGLVSTFVTLALTPAVLRRALRRRDHGSASRRRRVEAATPRLGGISIVLGIAAGVLPSFIWLSRRSAWQLSGIELLGLLAALLVIFAAGLLDDLVDLAPLEKLSAQILAASCLVLGGWQFDTLRLPLEGHLDLGMLAPAVTLLWVLGVVNAINLIDGLDGLAAGLVAIIAGSLLLLAVLQNSGGTILVTACVVGACLGFLYHNRRPARIHMGDSGALTLGLILAAVSLGSPSVKASTTVAILVPLLALGLPIFDTLLVIWYRFLRGHTLLDRFASVVRADRAHIHYLLLDGYPERPRVLLTLYGMATAFCLMALLVAVSGKPWLGLGFLGVEFLAVLLVRRTGLNRQAERLTAARWGELLRREAATAPSNERAEIDDAAAPDPTTDRIAAVSRSSR